MTSDDAAVRAAEAAMPGWKAVKQTSLEEPPALESGADSMDNRSPRTADAVMPSVDKLKEKYLGVSGRRSDAGGRARYSDSVTRDAAVESADTALVEMESGPLKKTVAVSKSQKKVIWSQG